METESCVRAERALAAVTSAPGYASRVSEVVQQIAQAKDEMSVLGLLAEAAVRLGADAAAFVSFIRDDGSHASYRFLLACDSVWCREYERHASYSQDPWLLYALTHSEPAIASDIPVGSRKQREISELAKSSGFASAVIVPAPSAGALSRLGVLCLGRTEEGYFEADGFVPLKIAARGLAMELHEWWIARIKRELIANADITDEEIELLRHERMGHQSKAIGAALGISPGAIDCRFQRLNQKLGVPTRRAAANLAAEYGLI